jgi:hypothetical protein
MGAEDWIHERSPCLKKGKPQEYVHAHNITISPARVLTFYWEINGARGFKKLRAHKVETSAPLSLRKTLLALSATWFSSFLAVFLAVRQAICLNDLKFARFGARICIGGTSDG